MVNLWVLFFFIQKVFLILGLAACKDSESSHEDKFLILERHFLSASIKL